MILYYQHRIHQDEFLKVDWGVQYRPDEHVAIWSWNPKQQVWQVDNEISAELLLAGFLAREELKEEYQRISKVRFLIEAL